MSVCYSDFMGMGTGWGWWPRQQAVPPSNVAVERINQHRRETHAQFDALTRGQTSLAASIRELSAKLDAVLKGESQAMGAIEDLDNAVTSLTNAAQESHTAVMKEIASLADALSKADDSPLKAAVAQATANIQAITGSIAQDSADLTKSIPAATTVTASPPAPVDTGVAPNVEPPEIEPVEVTAPNAQPPSQ